MFCKFEIAVYLSLRERICSLKEFAPLSILNLFPNEFASLRIFCKLCLQTKLFTPFHNIFSRNRILMNLPAAARNFFYRKYWRNYKKFLELSILSYFWHIIENLEYS